MMRKYYIEGLEIKEKYRGFVRYMVAYSDAFSLIYFRYTENERQKMTTKRVKNTLKPFLLYSGRTLQWPGTETMDTRHIYQLALYRCHIDVLPALESVGCLWDWDYPKHPMDLCFYREGYAWFWSVTHEGMNMLYIDQPSMISELESVGLEFHYEGNAELSELYYDKRTIHEFPKLENS